MSTNNMAASRRQANDVIAPGWWLPYAKYCDDMLSRFNTIPERDR